MKVLRVQLYLGESKITVLVEDRFGNRRLINYSWGSLYISNTPPDGWFESIPAEVEFQLTHEDNIKSGRILF